jgi:hypothetical protein
MDYNAAHLPSQHPKLGRLYTHNTISKQFDSSVSPDIQSWVECLERWKTRATRAAADDLQECRRSLGCACMGWRSGWMVRMHDLRRGMNNQQMQIDWSPLQCNDGGTLPLISGLVRARRAFSMQSHSLDSSPFLQDISGSNVSRTVLRAAVLAIIRYGDLTLTRGLHNNVV